MNVSRAAVQIRPATPADASLIAGLYRDAYTPPSGGNAREHYPFPQFLNKDWVSEAVARANVCWMVAQVDERIVGSAGALRNIGSDADRVAEVYGIVVAPQFRGQRIGRGLLDELCRELADHPQFVLCESRTAVPAGWRVARTCGFRPLGFEPFAHATPAGPEAMLLTGKVAESALAARTLVPRLTEASRRIAAEILTESCFRGASDGIAQACCERQPYRHGSVKDSACQNEKAVAAGSRVSAIRDDMSGPRIAAGLAHEGLHDSGIVGLRRLEGEDPDGRRYDRQYYVARDGSRPVATLLVVLDRVDHRARILEMRTFDGRGRAELLAFVFASLEAKSRDTRLSVVVDVCADAVDLQETLEQLGCLPTVYYPSLVAKGNERVDAVQYTRLFNADFAESLRYAAEVDWLEAQQVVRRVSRLWTRVLDTNDCTAT